MPRAKKITTKQISEVLKKVPQQEAVFATQGPIDKIKKSIQDKLVRFKYKNSFVNFKQVYAEGHRPLLSPHQKTELFKYSLFSTLILTAVVFAFTALQPKQIPNTALIKSAKTTQLTKNPVAKNQPTDKINWIVSVNTKDIKENQKYLALPKNSKDIKLTKFKTTKEAEVYINQKQQENPTKTLTLEDRRELSGTNTKNIFAKFTKWTASLANVFLASTEDAVENLVEAIDPVDNTIPVQDSTTQETTTVESTQANDATIVDLSTQLPETPASAAAPAGEAETQTPPIEPATEPETTETDIPVTETTSSTTPEVTQTPASVATPAGEVETIVAEYTTEAPTISEQETEQGKLVTVESPDESNPTLTPETPASTPVTDVIAHTTIPEIYKVGQESKIKLKWKSEGDREVTFKAYDLNNNGKLDYVEWTVPHLSEQIFEIIFISKAWRLDSNKEITEDIYDIVKEKDGSFATINENEYIQATFNDILDNTKDITIHAKPNGARAGAIEIYAEQPATGEGSNDTYQEQLVATIENINSENTYRVNLTDLLVPTDKFDIKIKDASLDIDYIVDPVAWLTGWAHRKKITIDNSNVDADLTNFPLLVKFTSDTDLATALSTGYDIRFTDSGGRSTLYYERESWTGGNGDAATGVFWVKVATIDDTVDTDIYVYYGKSDATDGQSATNVWDSDYKGVWHLNDPTNPTDSTSNDNDGTNNGVTATTGKIGGAGSFDSTYISAGAGTGTSLDITGSQITYGGWVYPTSWAGYQLVLGNVVNIGDRQYAIYLQNGDNSQVYYALGGIRSSGTSIPLSSPWIINAWNNIVVTYNNPTLTIYLNGSSVATATLSGDITTRNGEFDIGYEKGSNYPLVGKGDEIRVSSTARSADWIKFEYNNQGNADNELTISAQENNLTWLSGWSYRKKITIDHTKVGATTEDQTNFPVLISLTGLSNINTNGTDIRFTTSDGGTSLAREIESYVPGTGTLTAWVKIPLLSHTADTVIYMYYGNSSATEPAADSTYGKNNVWDSNFKGVWHLNDPTNPTDSTSNANNGTPSYGSSFTTPPTTAERNDSPLAVGFKFTVSETTVVSKLGRLYVAGNTQDHGIKLWDESNTSTPVVSATILASSSSDSNNFKWASITPVTLDPAKTYRISVDEYSLGDTWKDRWSSVGVVDTRLSVQASCYGGLGDYPSTCYSGETIYDTPGLYINGVTATTGKIGGAGSFNGASYIDAGNNASVNITGNITIEAWAKSSSWNSQSHPMLVAKGINQSYILWQDGAAPGFGFRISSGQQADSVAISDNIWYSVVGVYNGSNEKVYLNGLESGTLYPLSGAIPTIGNNLLIGAGSAPEISNYLNGYVDEVRISDIARSAGWISTEYENQSSPSTFYTVGNVEGSSISDWLSGWSDRKKITIKNTQVDSDLTNFPLLVRIPADAELGAKSLSTGNDLRFTSSDGSTLLSYEKEDFSVSDLSTGLVGHWTMNDNTSNTTVVDSSGSGNNGTLTNAGNTSASHATGKMNGALSLDGTNDYVNVATNPLYRVGATAFTVSLWAYVDTTTFDGTDKGLIDDSTGNPVGSGGFYMTLDDRGGSAPLNGIQFALKTATGFEGVNTNDNVFGNAGWYLITATYGANAGKIYINGVESSSVYNASTGNFIPANSPLVVGAFNNGIVPITGSIDDVRIYNRALTAGEISALYNSSRGTELQSPTVAEGNFWVKVPTISSTLDTDIYMYYGNSSATDGQDATNVWDSNYKGVWHLNSLTADSTSNANTGTNNGVTSGTGKVGSGGVFDGASHYIGIATPVASSVPMTFSAWVNLDDLNNYYGILSEKGVINDSYNIGFDYNSFGGTKMLASSYNASGNGWKYATINSQPATNWQYVTGVFTDTETFVYVNGVASSSGPVTQNPTVTETRIGYDQWSATYFKGLIDEPRISNVARSADWIKFEYANMNSADNELIIESSSTTPDTTFVWTNGSGDGLWSTASNWQGGVVPSTTDIAVFNSSATDNCTLDTNISVAGINITAGYIGNITQSASYTVTIGTEGFTQSGGTFTGGDSAITISGNFTLSGGTFTATSGTTTFGIGGNPTLFTHTAGGTFDAGSGTVIFVGFANWSHTADVDTSETFNNLTILTTYDPDPGYPNTFTISSGDTFIVNGTLTLTSGRVDGGTINAKGAISVNSIFYGGSATILIDGTGNQSFTIPDGATTPIINLNNALTTITCASGTTGVNGLTLQAGTFNAGDSTLSFNYNFVLSGGTFNASSGTTTFNAGVAGGTAYFTHTAGGTFNAGSGTVVLASYANWGHTIDVDTSEIFNNLTILTTYDPAGDNVLTLSSGDTLVANGTLTLSGGVVNGGTLNPKGAVTIGSGYKGGTVALSFSGTANQIITNSGGTMPSGTFTINKPSGSVTLGSNLVLNSSGQDLNVQSGTLDLAGYNLTVNDQFIVNGTLKLHGDETLTTPTLGQGSTVEYTKTSGTTAIKNWSYYNISINGNGGTFTLPANTTVAGNLTITNGTLDATASNYNLTVNGSWTQTGGTFNPRSATVTMAGGGTITATSAFNNLTINAATSVPASNLKGWWKFDDASGITATDSSGNGKDGQISGATWTTGILNGALSFDGANDSINIAPLSTPTAITISSWFKPTSVGALQMIYSLVNGNSHQLRMEANGKFSALLDDSSLITGTTVASANNWYHVLATNNGSTTTLYVNGTQEASGAQTYFVPSGNSMIGAANNGTSLFANGIIDDVHVYNSVLTTAQIRALASGNEPGYTLGADLSVAGNLANTAGTFNTNSKTVTLSGTNQTISGSTTFYNLTKQVSSADTLTFTAGTTQTITNTLTLNGASGQLLSLRSSSEDTQWNIDPQGTRTISYLDVQDSNNIDAVIFDTAGMNCNDSGNNTNWQFDITPPTTTATGTSGNASYTIGDWTNDPVRISLSCDDGNGAGCQTTYYCVDTTNTCTPTTTYTSAFTVSAYGTSYIRYYSTDTVPNTETVNSGTIKINNPESQGGSGSTGIISQTVNVVENIVSKIVDIVTPNKTPTSQENVAITYPPIEEVVTKEAPLPFQNWDIMQTTPIGAFDVFAVPTDIAFFENKLPEFKKLMDELGINSLEGANKLVDSELTLPGLSSIALKNDLETSGFSSAPGTPVANLTIEQQKNIPSDIVFARSGGELIDYPISLSFDKDGVAEQKITTITGKPLELVVKTDNPAKRVTGILTLRQKQTAVNGSNNFISYIKSILTASITGAVNNAEQKVADELLLEKFEYKLVENGIYKAQVVSPLVEGEYNITTIVEYKDEKLKPKQTRLVAVVDPEGYIYRRDGNDEVRVRNAVVSIYWFNKEKNEFEFWNAEKFLQTNPQKTNETGKYSFLTPEGKYYIRVEADGYNSYKSENFDVKKEIGIHMNIKLTKKFVWMDLFDWKYLAGIIILGLVGYIIYQKRSAMQLKKQNNEF